MPPVSSVRASGLAAAALLVLATAAPAGAAVDLAVLAYEGGPAPGVPGAVLRSLAGPFAPPILNEAGDVVFWGELESGPGGVSEADDTGLWGPGPGGDLLPRVREGQPLPGVPGAVFGDVLRNGGEPFALDDAGRLGAFLEGVLHVSEPGGAPVAVAVTGELLPGMPAPWDDDPLEAVHAFSLDAGGAVVVAAGLPGTTAGLLLWTGGAALQPIVFPGDPVPDVPGGVFSYLGGPVFAQAGRIAHPGRLVIDGWYATPALWTTDPGEPGSSRLVARADEPPAGGPATAVYAEFAPVRSAGGPLAFLAWPVGMPQCTSWYCNAIFVVHGPEAPARVAATGEPAFGDPAGALFGLLSQPAVNAAGELAFHSHLAAGPGDSSLGAGEGIWSAGDAGLVLRARTGQGVPGIPGAVYTALGFPSLGDRGHLVFWAEYAEAAGTGNALMLVRPDGSVEPVVRTGQSIEVAPGDLRSVGRFAEDWVLADARPHRRLNGFGETVRLVPFADGSSAVILARPRAGSGCGLGAELVLLAPLLARRARRRRR